MEKEIEIHNFENKNIRIFGTHEEPWFAVKDVCKILDLSNVTVASSNIQEKWKKIQKTDSGYGPQDMIVVNESGLYVTVNKRGDILLPLNSVKGVGESAKSIMDNQPYDNLMDLASRARPNRGLIESLSQANALDCFSEVRSKSVDQIMELWDETINRRSQQEKEANRLAKQKYTVISPLEQMMKNDDEFQGFTDDIKSQKKTREPKKIRIKSSLDLFPDDLL